MITDDYKIEDFLTALSLNEDLPLYVQRDARSFLNEMEDKGVKRIKSRVKKTAQKVDSKIPRIKITMPESTND